MYPNNMLHATPVDCHNHTCPSTSKQSKLMTMGYLFERFCWLSFTAPLFVTAIKTPGYYGHLTYWTLALHAVYFTVDKSSPDATTAVYLLHGMSFCGAMAVFIGYTLISLGGMYRWGSWIAWENAVGAAAGTVLHDRSFAEAAPNKIYEHLWPVFALVFDIVFSRAKLQQVYAGTKPLRTMLLGLGSYLVYASIWEQYSKATKGAKGSSLVVYQQPDEFGSSYLLGRLGIDSTGVPEDAIFANAQKVILISFAAVMYRMFVTPLFKRQASSQVPAVYSSPKKKRP